MARQSAQHKLDRVRPPRVQITYDVEIGGAIEIKELPFVVGVLGDFTGQPEQPLPRLKDRKFVEVNPDNFDTVLEGMKPHLSFAVENKLSDDPNAPQLKVDLHFKKMEDFEPGNVAKQVKPLKELLDLAHPAGGLAGHASGQRQAGRIAARRGGQHREARQAEGRNGKQGRRVQWLIEATAQPAEAEVLSTQEKGLLDQIVEQGRFGADTTARERGKNLVKEFVAQVLEGSMTVAKDAEMMINARIAQIDHLLSIQLNEILHHPTFQKLEGSWRGLKHLMDHSETGVGLKIQVLNVSKKELLRDIEKAPEFDQSALFKKVYEEEYGVFGGAPFGALIGDYEFGKHPEDMALLEGISHVAAQAHAPFVSAAAADLLNLESFTQLGAPRDLAKIFDSTEYAKWKSFRQSEDSRYVALMLAQDSGPPPVWQRYKADRRLQLRRTCRWHGSQQVPVDECGLLAGYEDDELLTRCTACASRCAESKAEDWSKVFRSTTSTPTRAIWH